jgi:hypothetical protein
MEMDLDGPEADLYGKSGIGIAGRMSGLRQGHFASRF